MSGVTRLDGSSFYVTPAGNGRKGVLNLRAAGEVLVLFTLPGCPGCRTFYPKFAQLAGGASRVKFATIDLKGAPNLVRESRKTTTEIKAVPTQILYVNGRPHAKFKGEFTAQSTSNFINKALAAYKPPQQRHPTTRAPEGQFHTQPQGGAQGAGTMYGPGPMSGGGAYNAPDIRGVPSMARRMQGFPESQYGLLGNPNDPDEHTLALGGDVRPHNQPWSSEFKSLG
uniref:Thioredoxin n=1 Tax=Marseillevirus LCMAC103 TaxID=2506604 RepID=A0A481YVV6_9VIRU|nr:MAG: thioredoxin [Marseillevirus LCMAC103]